MGKHSGKKISYWEARRRRRDLCKNANAKAKGPRSRIPFNSFWFIVFFVIGIALGGALGFYAKPIAKLSAKIYLSFKESTWKAEPKEQKKVQKALTTLSVSYTHLRAHETRHDLVCRLLLEKKK